VRLRDPEKLTAALKAADLSGAQLGRRVGVSRNYISKLATGKIQTCSTALAMDIEEALQVRTGALFMRESEPARTQRGSSQRQALAS